MKLLITIDQVKALTSMTANIDANAFENAVEIAQLEFIKPKLGKDLYNELVEQLTNNTLTTLNHALMYYVRKALAWYVFYVSIQDLNIKARNKGLMKENSEASSNIDRSEVDAYAIDRFNKGNTYMKELIAYLTENNTDYPLYVTADCCEPKSTFNFRVI